MQKLPQRIEMRARVLIPCQLSALCGFSAAVCVFSVAVCVFSVCAFPTTESLAAPGTPPVAAEARATGAGQLPRTSTHGSSLSRLSQAIGQLPLTEASLVVFGPLGEQGEVKLSDDARKSLHVQLVQIVGSGVSLARTRLSEALSPREARTQARRRGLALVYIAPSMAGGSLALEVTFTQWPTSFWQRTLLPEGTTTLHESLRVPADELIRRLLPPARGLMTETKKFKNPIQSPVALSCGDIDGDGGQELLIVGRRDLALGRFTENQFVTEVKSNWADLSPVADSPLRAPLGAAQMDESGAIIGLSDRARMVKLDSQLKLLSDAPRAYPLSVKDCVQFTPTGLSENSFQCDFHPAGTRPAGRGALDALAMGQVTEPSGVVSRVTTVLPVGEDSLTRVESGAHTGAELKSAKIGDAFVWSDLDGDGSLELLSSSASGANGQDAILVHSLKEGRLRPLTELKAGPIHAVIACPFAGSNPLLVVAAVGNELWVLQ